jgi:hypothetical protein
MKNISKVLAGLPLVLSGCGGGGSSSTALPQSSSQDIATFKGTWANDSVQTFTTASGNTTSFGRSEGLITSDRKMAYVTGDYKAIFTEPGTSTGHYYSAYTYVDTVDISFSQSGSNLEVSFRNNQREITGTIQLSQSSDYATAVSLGDIAGTWVDDASDNYHYSNNGDWTITFLSDGSFSGSSTTGCSTTGNFATIDGSSNEFSVSMTVTMCGNSANNPFNGTHTGIAYKTTNEIPQDMLVIMTTNGFDATSRALIIKPTR